MNKTLNLYTCFGTLYALAVFEGYFTPLFAHQDGFNVVQMFVAGLVAAIGAKGGQIVGRRVISLHPETELWRFDFRRWIGPYLAVLILLPLTGAVIGYVLRGNPVLVIAMAASNFILTPILFVVMTRSLKRDRLAHICFSALSTWLIWLPFSIIQKQPLQLWFAAFTSAGLLAIAGYLMAQGLESIRRRPMVL
ncbi:hypothetical protein [Burkholderia pyrrocinia]|uniref:hypothetical protein n=1 Tax=Burkholderia pyrrocinia TaxID=60550 RepID=UPI001588F6D6|nr:hypothetical protein [Burkholderia pyrrocinia]